MIDDKYTYAGSGGVLINRFNIRDPDELDDVLNSVASRRWAELLTGAPPQHFTFETLRAIHERLLGEVLPFAGTLRDVDTQDIGAGVIYCRPDFIQGSLDTAFAALRRQDFLTGRDAKAFAQGLAAHWGELSAIHPFRDGNTRSQCAYVSLLAAAAGHPIRWTSVDVDQLRRLRLAAVTGVDAPLADYLEPLLGTPGKTPERLTFARRTRPAAERPGMG